MFMGGLVLFLAAFFNGVVAWGIGRIVASKHDTIRAFVVLGVFVLLWPIEGWLALTAMLRGG